jgi:hypothetical protein
MKYKGTLIDAWLQTITDDRDEYNDPQNLDH